jgi:hypothetical protein
MARKEQRSSMCAGLLAWLLRPQPVAPARWIGYFGYAFGWVAWYRKRTLRELAEFEKLRRSLGDEGDGGVEAAIRAELSREQERSPNLFSPPTVDHGLGEAAEARH